MAAKLLSGLSKGVYKGGRTRLAIRFAGRKAGRKVQRYFGYGRYNAEPRLAKILAKTIFPPAKTSSGATITGLSPRARKAQRIAGSLVGAQRARQKGLAVAGLGAYAGGVGVLVYKGQKKKKTTGHMVARNRKRKT